MKASGASRVGVGALIGLISGGVALGVGEVVAALVRPAASPVIAVGNRFILLTPEPVKRWAIRTFGSSDKLMLLSGIYLVIALFAIVVGVLALRHVLYGLAGIVVFAAIGVYCALTANASHGSDVVPTVVGAVAAGGALVALLRSAGPNATFQEPAGLVLQVSDRRRFLQGSAAAAGLALISGFGGRAVANARYSVEGIRKKIVLPAPVDPAPAEPAPAEPTGPAVSGGPDLGKSPIPWATPNADFYRVDTALSVPQLDPNGWKLRIHGMVDHPMTLTYQDILDRPLIERWITLCCVSNEVGGDLVGNAKFLGARLADVLREAGVQAGAEQLVLTSSDGMTIGAPTAVVMDGRDALLAVGMNGVPLPVKHGFPVRTVVPGLYGYVSACKWIVDIEATTYDQQPYWVQGGYLARPPLQLESRIDTPGSGRTVAVGRPAAIAGVAWDQHVGVSKVQVQVDDGQWLTARLATVPSTDTWRQWVVAWTPPSAGSYTVRVRATDSAGNVQTADRHQPFPGGATGLHTITVRAR